jgi:aminopeptidase-like protein
MKNFPAFESALGSGDIGKEMHHLISELYPICRSITGEGVRRTLDLVQRHVPLEVHEVPSGTKVFDWTVPPEWNIQDAYVKNAKGERIVDFKKSNLHVVGYSAPVNKMVSLKELKSHLFTLPDYPDWIPYRTSYYKETWGFCLSHRQWSSLREEEYDVCIDSSLKAGHLSYGEFYLQGATTDEILISCHVCHPSLCNDNLSGIALATFLAKALTPASRRYSYRFLFIPGTIGSITWLCLNESNVSRIKHGLVVTGVGDSGKPVYKKSRRGNAEIDKAFAHVLKHSGGDYEIIDFFPYGYDERQYCSPGFNLPVGCLMRTPHGQYPEYHTSADNLDFVQPPCLADSFAKTAAALHVIENNRTYINLNPKCEPQLGRRGLYQMIGGHQDAKSREMAMLWVLNLADGNHNLLDIADKSGLEFSFVKDSADLLAKHGLLTNVANSRLGV